MAWTVRRGPRVAFSLQITKCWMNYSLFKLKWLSVHETEDWTLMMTNVTWNGTLIGSQRMAFSLQITVCSMNYSLLNSSVTKKKKKKMHNSEKWQNKIVINMNWYHWDKYRLISAQSPQLRWERCWFTHRVLISYTAPSLKFNVKHPQVQSWWLSTWFTHQQP